MNWSSLLSNLMGPAVVAAIVSGLFNLFNNIRVERRKRSQDVKDFLIIRRQELESDGELVSIRVFLQEEDNARRSGKPAPCWPDGMNAYFARRLPAFLERIGIYLLRKTPNKAEIYKHFYEEVRLYANSIRLWEGDDWRRSPFWNWFRKFVEATDWFAPLGLTVPATARSNLHP